ncbi:MAG: hypothetical protein LBQ16_05985 [Gracilibacteraceae bacterium]|jgi:hypothetical protein|nr:hypothetical protein [Gracilibacteraceae bacterium]
MGSGRKKVWQKRLVFFLALCLCQGLIWLTLDAQARQWLMPSHKNERSFVVPLSLASARNLQLSYNSKYLSALSGGELLIIRLGARQPLNESAVAAYAWAPDRDVLAAVKTDGAGAVLTVLEIKDLGRAGGEAREIYRLALPAAVSGAEFAFSVYRDEIYIAADLIPAQAPNQGETALWRVDARGVTVMGPDFDAGGLEFTARSDPPAAERGEAVLVPAPDGYSVLRLTEAGEYCTARWLY